MADGLEVPGLGALDRLRAQASALGDEDVQGTASLQPHACPGDGEGPPERGPQLAAAPPGGMTLHEDSTKRVERKAHCDSTCLSDCSLTSDSGIFEPLLKRKDAEESVYGDPCSNEEPQIHVGFLHDSGSECLLVKVLQLKNFAGLVVKEDCKIHIRIYLPPLDSSKPNSYCSKALEFHLPLVFNEVFRIPVPSSMKTSKLLQLYICSMNHQLQEELLGITQINLSDYENSSEMELCWYSVQIFTNLVPQRTRKSEHAEESFSHAPAHSVSGKMDAVTVLLSRTTAQLQAVEQELVEERVMVEYIEEEILKMDQKEDQTEAASKRSWQAHSVDSKCSNYTQTSTIYLEPSCFGIESIRGHMFAGQADTYNHEQLHTPPLKVDKETNTEDPFLEEVVSLRKERASHRPCRAPFVRSSTIVCSQTFLPGARSQYVCKLYRSDSDSSTLPRKSPFVPNTLERTLCYKQSCRSSLATLMARTSLDLELYLQASRTRQKQLNEKISTLRELRQQLEDAPVQGQTALPVCVLWDERFRNLLKEIESQTRQTKLDQNQEQAAEKMLKKASKEIHQLHGQNHMEPIQVQIFREKMAFFTRPWFSIPPLPADDV